MLIFFDGDMEYCCLLDTIELPALDIVPIGVSQYGVNLVDNSDQIALRET